MTTWGKLEVGSRIISSHDGFDGEYIVKVLKRGGLGLRAVLEAVTDRKVAKVAVRVRHSDEVELAPGSALPDRAGSAIASALGATEVAELTIGESEFICDAVDFTTIRSHLHIMHGVELQGLPEDSDDDLMRVHQELHDAPFHEPAHPHRHREAIQ